MWLAMYICYFFNFISLILLGITALQGYIPFLFIKANHSTTALLAIIVYFFRTNAYYFFSLLG